MRNTGIYGSSVNNGVGNCITARVVDQEGDGSVGKLYFTPGLPVHYRAHNDIFPQI